MFSHFFLHLFICKVITLKINALQMNKMKNIIRSLLHDTNFHAKRGEKDSYFGAVNDQSH
ncbi:hypothetical protein ACM15_17360 [Parabacteroides goldsteinii]|uniref:Uncharacterized protein n=3 Tax=Parabacteroides goldsteinii TaxID=328812 RepID=A0A0J6CGU2_9BACT|nr:hypothetical protein ACM15_17360 [Parabacteroides goldsteinii]